MSERNGYGMTRSLLMQRWCERVDSDTSQMMCQNAWVAKLILRNIIEAFADFCL